ncbi:MAG: Uma2 family endonuclease [Cyanobacteriota bacterium ELA615]
MAGSPTKLEIHSLEVPDTLKLQVTPEQFEQLAIVNRDLRLERTSNGELIVNPPTGSESGRRNLNLTGQLFLWIREHEELGEGFDSSTAFTLPNGAIRSPDASWVSRKLWDSLSAQQKKGFAQVTPEFVVELRSPSDNLDTLREKMREYIDNGSLLGWLINPQDNQVEIYRKGQAVEILENPNQLSGEDVLLGFSLDLKRVMG